ncbi:hypothetical protein TPHA_0G02610 [Tetrapisispora phaffii CBS 4417]|uniref:RING-type domain-containing protein n=1 Tax=Tetrapisispora phaffii (strain ATCC 24235 / CBS 4417 / NBRC 1672 / NRRL Y-8282 / UCD 70-5) TaxID=1071381 RepID=G8BW20_TETPH|nr:hypothetical protein TPHA_0G02610 [Tetrapisispora phaffii CBS 4417]CCE64098.1 hypothetical protein TPHA_0G02610 [Tetrapisispora phaffii CBS 4417]
MGSAVSKPNLTDFEQAIHSKEEKRRYRINALNQVVSAVGSKLERDDRLKGEGDRKYFLDLENFSDNEIAQAKNLIAKIDETIDGGFLAPTDHYYHKNLDFDTFTLRTLIKERKLQPFYKPISSTEMEKYRNNGIGLINHIKNLPPNNIPIESKKLKADNNCYSPIQEQIDKWESIENDLYFKALNSAESEYSDYLPNDRLLTLLHTDSILCSNCDRYFASNINRSWCCKKPICSGCLLNIQKLKPTDACISCPFCRKCNLTVYYEPFNNIRTSSFSSPKSKESNSLPSKFKILINNLKYGYKIETVEVSIFRPSIANNKILQ